ncbi:phospholipase [Bradyrhizobium sp. KBS0727]|uniref:phospholipase n=1 Tax=unclassified Bradyrhizobium TaxID=2631580 RepID=UPI00110EA3B8|nr:MULTISPECIES: phospholipase [unclassified Bradyrhizobium]QDW39028.1 phospholipase [Bradyrhizobium sp. KBS0725]QDW45631.1 phospholipase [Bradyrhizobium sp. KBS0727]
MAPRRAHLDLSPKEFRDALVDHGFAYLTPIGRYVDIRERQVGRYLDPVRDRSGRILRRQTLAALLAARDQAEAARAMIRQAHARRQAIAGKIAPHVVSPCRADLKGTAAIAQLADDFLTRFASAGHVQFLDLIQMGWRADQLKAHADDARAVADRKAVLA